MATVIRIDPDDELPSIIERLPARATCVLALPPHSRALNSGVAAKLLCRRAEAMGSRVVVVTADHAVIAHARTAGLAVAATVDEARHMLDDDDAHVEPGAAAASPPDEAISRQDTTVMPSTPLDARPDGDSHHTGVGASATPHQPPEKSWATIPGNAAGERHEGASDAAKDADSAAPSAGSARSGAVRGGSTGGSAGRAGSARRTSSRPAPASARSSSVSGPLRVIMPAALVIVPLLLLGWLAFYALSGILNPSATLTLRPRAVVVMARTTVDAVMDLPLNKRNNYRIGMSRLTQAEQATVNLPVRGTTLVPDRTASGSVQLVNLTAKPLLVPRGTTFTTALNKVSFVSTRDVTIPAARLTFTSSIYGFGVVPIKAATGGTAGNVSKGTIVNVPASLSGAINVRNVTPTSGGTDKPVRVVAPHDLAVTSASLMGALKQKAQQDVARRFGGDVEQQIVAVDPSPAVQHMAPDRRSATLTLSIVAHIAYVHRHDLFPAATAALQPVIRARPGESFIPGSIGWTAGWTPVKPITATDAWDPSTASTETIAMSVTGHLNAPLDVASLLHAIGGRSKSEAMAYLHGRHDIASADISLSPPWADHLPSDVTRIHVSPQQPQ